MTDEFEKRNKVTKIALAAIIHDIGKFSQRASYTEHSASGFFPDKVFMKKNAALFQPFNLKYNKYTHRHAIYTAAFVNSFEKILPTFFNSADCDLGDEFIKIAACHHKPETPLQNIVTIADRLSSEFDRDRYEKFDWSEGKIKDYLHRRMVSVFEGINLSDEHKGISNTDLIYRLPLSELTSDSIFPVEKNSTKEDSKAKYGKMFESFIFALENLMHKENPNLWFEHFDSLLMLFTSQFPAATVGDIIPDISLYDHSRTVAAIASAIYAYHLHTDTISESHIRDTNTEKFLLIEGDFYGIQDFIFATGGNTNKYAAKLLRGRSFYVSLMTELAADLITRKIGLSHISVIMNAAGKFVILAPNTKQTVEKLKECETLVNKWLLDNFLGQNAFGISSVTCCQNDFISDNFPKVWRKLGKKSASKKYSRFDMTKVSGSFKNSLDEYKGNISVCSFCGKRAGIINIKNKDEFACKICSDQIYFGESIVKSSRIAILTKDSDIKGKKLSAPIFGEYQVSFETSGELNNLSQRNQLLKLWDISIPTSSSYTKKCTVKFINGYVPVYSKADNNDDRLIMGMKSEEKKLELIDMINENQPKSFSHISRSSIKLDCDNNAYGVEALGVLKADVDNLGSIFANGFARERRTITRMATLSRQLNHFFAAYIPNFLKNAVANNYNNVYTVFAGGDDLFLIGPWSVMVDLAEKLRNDFKRYTAMNNDVSISMGITLHKHNDSVRLMAESSKSALEKSKSEGRDRLTIFSKSIKWQEVSELNEIETKLTEMKTSGKISTAFMYKLCSIAHSSELEVKSLNTKSSKSINLSFLEHLKWKATFKYVAVRHSEKHKINFDELGRIGENLSHYRGKMIVPLWLSIYKNRKWS